MRSRALLVLTAFCLPLLAGCIFEPEPEPVVVTVAPEPEPEPEPPPPPPVFPPAEMALPEAERALANDPMALRFLTLRALTETGRVPRDEAMARKDANIGALLPLTGGRNPSVFLELPVPPVDAVMARFQRLDEARHWPEASRAAERAFLLDQLLPVAPGKGIVMAPHDKIQARQLLDRLDRIEQAGLIDDDEHAREQEAVEILMATLPETLRPPPPPPPQKVAKKSRTGSSARRMPGGVSGQLVVIPSPFEFEPPKLTAEYTGQAGAHLLSMASSDHGARAWQALKNQFSFELGSLSYTVERADLGSLGVTHRLIAGPMDPQQAERLCAALRAKGQACLPTPFPSVGPVPEAANPVK